MLPGSQAEFVSKHWEPTEEETQSQIRPKLFPSILVENRKKYIAMEGRNRSRNPLPLSAVSSGKGLQREHSSQCWRRQKGQQEKGGSSFISRQLLYRKAVLLKPKIPPFSCKNTIKYKVRGNAWFSFFLCTTTTRPVPGTRLRLPRQSRPGHDTLMHHYKGQSLPSTKMSPAQDTSPPASSLSNDSRTGVLFVHQTEPRERKLQRQSITSIKSGFKTT